MSVASLIWRSDLVVSHQQTSRENTFVVKDPATGRFFRLQEVEHFIACQLNGAISLEELQRRVEEKFGGTVPSETLERFIERLRGLGLLEDPRSAGASVARPRRRVAGSLFYLRFKAFDPDRFFDWLVGQIAFFFTPAFVAT